jgi:hypothetical protein
MSGPLKGSEGRGPGGVGLSGVLEPSRRAIGPVLGACWGVPWFVPVRDGVSIGAIVVIGPLTGSGSLPVAVSRTFGSCGTGSSSAMWAERA